MDKTNISEKSILLVDSCNFGQTYGVARLSETIKQNANVLELPSIETLVFEQQDPASTIVVFPFGRYIILCTFTEKEYTNQYFFDHKAEFDKTMLPLLLNTPITDSVIEKFQDLHFMMNKEFVAEDDTVTLTLATKPNE